MALVNKLYAQSIVQTGLPSQKGQDGKVLQTSGNELLWSTMASSLTAGSIALSKLSNMATASFIGRNTAGTGSPEVLGTTTAKTMLNLSGTNSGDQTITLSGAVTGTGTGAITVAINTAVVTYANIQNVTDARLLGRSAGSAGAPQEVTVGSGLTLLAGSLTNSSPNSGGVLAEQIFNTAGTFTVTLNAASNAYEVYGWGAGGGGGGALGDVGEGGAAAGGGGGGFFYKRISGISQASMGTITIVIGTGGSAGAAGNNAGTDGTATTWSDSVNSMTANGGKGGAGSDSVLVFTSNAPGSGGTASGGDLNVKGGWGGTGIVGTTTMVIGGYGGAAAWGTQAESNVNGSGAGSAGTKLGGGGSGGTTTNSATDRAGGAGATGLILLRELA